MADHDSRDAIAPAPGDASGARPTPAGPAVSPAASSGVTSEPRRRMRALLDQLERASPFESSSLARQVREQAAVLATQLRAG